MSILDRGAELASELREDPELGAELYLSLAVISNRLGRSERARELVEQELHGPGLEEPAWTCPGCGERIEGQFTECWNCGRERARIGA